MGRSRPGAGAASDAAVDISKEHSSAVASDDLAHSTGGGAALWQALPGGVALSPLQARSDTA